MYFIEEMIKDKRFQKLIRLSPKVESWKWDTEAGVLKRFDTFLAQHYPSLTALTKEAVTQ